MGTEQQIDEKIDVKINEKFNMMQQMIDVKLTSIQGGMNEMKSTLTVFVEKMSNLHKDYVPRSEIEKDFHELERDFDELKSKHADLEKRVGKLQGWRNWITGALAVIAFLIGIIAETVHFWKPGG